MTDKDRPHVYVQCDVPEGQTLAEFRAAHGVRKAHWLRRWFRMAG